MTKHKGFNYCNYASWDPRSDTLILYMKEIEEASRKFSIPNFENLVLHHEFNHRHFYKTMAIRDIVFNSSLYITMFFHLKVLKDAKQKLQRMKDTVPRFFIYFDDVGTVLDAIHAYRLYSEHQKKENIPFEDLKKSLAVILDSESKKIFDEFIWFNKNQNKANDILEPFVFSSLHPGIKLFIENREDMNYYPTQILHNLLETFQSISETNPKKADFILKKILTPPETQQDWINYYNGIMKELSKYNDNLFSITTEDPVDLELHFREQREPLIFKLLGRKFWQKKFHELSDEIPSLIIRKFSDGEYEIGHRKRIHKQTHLRFLVNLGLCHLQECVNESKELECYLCKIGFCKATKNQFSKPLHDTVKMGNEFFYN
ncbi:MAG: hypothetical protein IIA83_02980 [Thaumarchaeota archaeon]|nr:hypothetical protein [Nitrososphaerota archaeon]